MAWAVFVATHIAPARIASAASASSVQPTCGPYPCTTAAGRSVALATGRNPTSRISVRNASAPTTSTGEPAGNRWASRVADACAEVSTSDSSASIPIPRSRVATSAARREALFVAYARR